MAIKRLRIGKDFALEWPILTNGKPEPLEGRDLMLKLNTPTRKSVEIPFGTKESSILARISPDMQVSLGIYSLTLWENYGKDGQTVVDSCDGFQLVDHTCKENIPEYDEEDIIADYVNLSSGNLTFFPIIIDGGNTIEVDSELSETSTNPVENRAITTEVNSIKETSGEVTWNNVE